MKGTPWPAATPESRRKSMLRRASGFGDDFVRGEAARGPERRCQWIEGEYPKAQEIVLEGVDPDACKCMKPTVEGSSWCQRHLRMSLRPKAEVEALRIKADAKAVSVQRSLDVARLVREHRVRTPGRSHTPGSKGPGRDGW